MIQIVDLIDCVIQSPDDESMATDVNNQVKELCEQFPLYSELE